MAHYMIKEDDYDQLLENQQPINSFFQILTFIYYIYHQKNLINKERPTSLVSLCSLAI